MLVPSLLAGELNLLGLPLIVVLEVGQLHMRLGVDNEETAQ